MAHGDESSYIIIQNNMDQTWFYNSVFEFVALRYGPSESIVKQENHEKQEKDRCLQ